MSKVPVWFANPGHPKGHIHEYDGLVVDVGNYFGARCRCGHEITALEVLRRLNASEYLSGTIAGTAARLLFDTMSAPYLMGYADKMSEGA